MVDPGRVRRLLDRLAEEIHKLKQIEARSSEAIADDQVLLAAVKYGFIVAIETCIDVAHHIISSEGLRAPDSFAEAFRVLSEGGFIPAEQVGPLEEMSRFRNLLVHGYLDVDDRRVVEILTTRLGDFETFKATIARSVLK